MKIKVFTPFLVISFLISSCSKNNTISLEYPDYFGVTDAVDPNFYRGFIESSKVKEEIDFLTHLKFEEKERIDDTTNAFIIYFIYIEEKKELPVGFFDSGLIAYSENDMYYVSSISEDTRKEIVSFILSEGDFVKREELFK